MKNALIGRNRYSFCCIDNAFNIFLLNFSSTDGNEGKIVGKNTGGVERIPCYSDLLSLESVIPFTPGQAGY